MADGIERNGHPGKADLGDEAPAILAVRVDGRPIATIAADRIPCEITPDVRLTGATTIEFEDAAATVHRHELPTAGGWLHLSVRVHAALGCQADAVVTQASEHEAGAPLGDDDLGVRFQPFFLAGASDAPDLTGRGMFARGLHFPGVITPSNIMSSCECDACRRSFLVRSIHTGFAEQTYFYSASGRYTLLVDDHGAQVPPPSDAAALRSFEATLPTAPDGTRFAYRNPFRCPHCAAAYIDFAAHKGEREAEYYALYLAHARPIHHAPAAAPEPSPSALARLKGLFR